METTSVPAMTPPTSPGPLGNTSPTGVRERIDAMDVARGFALLGIVVVNMEYFAQSVMKVGSSRPPEGSSGLDTLAFYVVHVLGQYNFFTLFSTLFGMGLMIQWFRALQAMRSFGAHMARRLFFLGCVGLFHGWLLWYGDILFLYALMGGLALLFVRARPMTLLITAGVIIAVSSLLFGVVMGFMAWSESQTAPSTKAIPPEMLDRSRLAIARLWDHLDSPAGQSSGQDDPVWIHLETEAFKEGGFLNALTFRLMNWAFGLFMMAMGFGWIVLAMFLVGMAMLKVDFFAAHNVHLQRRVFQCGWGIGLPLAVLCAVLGVFPGTPLAIGVGTALRLPAGVGIALGSLAGVSLWVASGKASGLARWLGGAGRMAMSVYLLQTVLATGIFYWWGLGWFGDVPASGRLGIAVGIFVVLLIAANLAGRMLRFGPMEWLWRSFTYWKLQPLRRSADLSGTAGVPAPDRS